MNQAGPEVRLIVEGGHTVRMSRASRSRREQSKRTSVRADLSPIVGVPERCDCLACSGEDVDPAQMVAELLDGVATLAESEDPLDAELAGAAFVAIVTVTGIELVPAFVQVLIPQIEARSGSDALALLLGIGSVTAGVHEQVAGAASAAACRLVAAGVPKPRWADELGEPVQVEECVRLYDSREAMSVLVAAFRRAGRGHALMVVVDEQDCGAATDILFLDAEHLSEALDEIRAGGRADGLDLSTQALDPAELRWYVEEALQARAVHEEERDDAVPVTLDEEEAPPYPVLALLVRARLAALPRARRPAGARTHAQADLSAASMLAALANLIGDADGGPRGGFGGPRSGMPARAKLPAKRKKSAGAAPVYQVKIGLRGAKPPIWRRLMVPADVSLAGLHEVIQAAFGWDDSHMHVFATSYGDFGRADRELGHRAEAPVTLEQVAPRAGHKIRYTYDFGDDWEHEIVVEKILDPDPALAYPCCTGGRQAAPPEDCGGIWGYEELREILADPDRPEHEERREWLGLDDDCPFDPAAFDLDEVNRALGQCR